MTTIQARVAYTKRSASAALLLMLLVGGCDGASNVKTDAAKNSAVATSQAKTGQLWDGDAQGYVAQGDPAQDEVVFLVYLGHVQAAIGRVNDHQKEDGMLNPFTPKVLAEYAAIDPVVVGLARKDLSLYPLLSEVAAAETFAVIVDESREQRLARNAIHQQLVTLIGRVDGIVTEIFPSTQASALAMSALVREAGELLRLGLSVDGQILDETQYRDALRLIDAALRLRVKKISACGLSREAAEHLEYRGPIGELLDRLNRVSESGVVAAGPRDAFVVAQNLADLGARLPTDDKQICP